VKHFIFHHVTSIFKRKKLKKKLANKKKFQFHTFLFLFSNFQSKCDDDDDDDFDTSGVRLVGELVSDEEKLDVEIEDGEEQMSVVPFDALSFSQSTSLIIIMLLVPGDVDTTISTSSSELVDSGDLVRLLLSSLGTRLMMMPLLLMLLLLLNRFLRFRHGSVNGNGG
jgi:hypothetical protein